MRRLTWLALALVAALATPAAALADKSFTLPRAAVTVTLARTGEVLVREDLTFSYSGFFTGAYRDIPLAPDVSTGDVEVSEAGEPYLPGGSTALGSSDAAGRFGVVRLPQGLRIVWHYQQNGGERTFTLRYRLRNVVTAYDDAVEVAPQVWGNQWESGLGHLAASVQAAGALPGTRGWIEPPWLDHSVSVTRGDVRAEVEDIPGKRGVILRVLYPPSALAPGAPYARHVHENVLAATIAREQAAADRAERDRRELEDTLHHPWAWILAALALAIVPAALLGGLAYWRFGREHSTGAAPEYVHEPPDDLAPALVPSLLAQRVVAGGDQLAATLFELVRRGRYTMTAVTREESSFGGLRHKEVDDVDLSRGDESIQLNPVEKPVAEIFDRLTADGPAALSQVAGTVKDLPDSDREWFHGRSEAFESAVGNQARQRKFWSGHGMLVKWLAFAAFLLVGGGPDHPRRRRDRRSPARAPGPDPHRPRRGARPERRRRALPAGAHVAQAPARATGLRRAVGGVPALSRGLPAAGGEARRHAAAVGELPGLRDLVRDRRARARGRARRFPGDLAVGRLRPRPVRPVVQRRELRLGPRLRVPVALERKLRRWRRRRLVRRRRRRRLVIA